MNKKTALSRKGGRRIGLWTGCGENQKGIAGNVREGGGHGVLPKKKVMPTKCSKEGNQKRRKGRRIFSQKDVNFRGPVEALASIREPVGERASPSVIS